MCRYRESPSVREEEDEEKENDETISYVSLIQKYVRVNNVLR